MNNEAAEISPLSKTVSGHQVDGQSTATTRFNDALARCALKQYLNVSRQGAAAKNTSGMPSTRGSLRSRPTGDRAAQGTAPANCPPNASPASNESLSSRDHYLNKRLIELLQTVRRRLGPRVEANQDIMVMAQPRNTILNLTKMVLVPIVLVGIAVMLVPHLQDVAKQTFNAIFYNCKLPESRGFEMKRITVGVMLLFDHVVKKLFPVIRLRWSNNKMFRRRNQMLGQRIERKSKTVPNVIGRPQNPLPV